MAYGRQSRPDARRGFQGKVLHTLCVVPSSRPSAITALRPAFGHRSRVNRVQLKRFNILAPANQDQNLTSAKARIWP